MQSAGNGMTLLKCQTKSKLGSGWLRAGVVASKRLKRGDHFFLIRLGEEPRGIFASGIIEQGSYKDLHWDSEKALLGETTNFVQIYFDTLLIPPIDIILHRELLDTETLSKMHWNTQISGVYIPDDVAYELEKLWSSF